MIKVGIVALGDKRWWGDVIYKRNLLYAISQLKDREISPVVISSTKMDKGILSLYAPYTEKIIQDSLFDAGSVKWLMSRVGSRVSDNDFLLYNLLRKHSLSVLSHAQYAVKGIRDCHTVSWIPDFQHIGLPEMFSRDEITQRNRIYGEIAEKSDLVILSSHCAAGEFTTFAPMHVDKARVLHFVSQPSSDTYDMDRSKTESKFGHKNKYFFLPNQFWKHKNHKVVFEAVKLLKDDGRDVLVVCSGIMNDRRNTSHVGELIEYINTNKLDRNIKLLGMIDHADLFCLMRNCVSCLNPSLFEGWSTTVEEAKSMGKNMILSDIPVHREQNPPESIYFDHRNAEELAEILWWKYNHHDGGPDYHLEAIARELLTERTIRFAETYQKIVLESLTLK